MTEATEPNGQPEPVDERPDPDDPRTAAARARGLSAPYVSGGRDPEIEATRREERRYLRLLVAMVVVILLSGFVLGIIGTIITSTNPR
jgi:hypothetical protein